MSSSFQRKKWRGKPCRAEDCSLAGREVPRDITQAGTETEDKINTKYNSESRVDILPGDPHLSTLAETPMAEEGA